MARTPIIYPDAGGASADDPHPDVHDVPAWFRGPDPDLAKVRELYVDRGLHECDVAKQLGISRARLAHVFQTAGIARRARPSIACPLTSAELGRRVQAGDTLSPTWRESIRSAGRLRAGGWRTRD